MATTAEYERERQTSSFFFFLFPSSSVRFAQAAEARPKGNWMGGINENVNCWHHLQSSLVCLQILRQAPSLSASSTTATRRTVFRQHLFLISFFFTKDLVQLRSSFSSNMRIQTHTHTQNKKEEINTKKKYRRSWKQNVSSVRLHLLPPTYFCGVILFLFSLFFLSFQFLSCISIVFRLQHSSHCFTCVCTS